MKNRWCLLVVMLGLFVNSRSQSIYTKMHGGAMYYQGDLAPQPINLSFGPANLSWGLSVGYNFNPWISIELGYMKGRISGDDMYSDSYSRRLRNLSFVSPVNEISVQSSLLINRFAPFLDKYKLRLYFNFGYSYFNFDPHTDYMGQWVRLQPLGTEGQNIPNYGSGPYSLNSFARVLGGSFEFDISKRLALGMIFAPRKTYTDYLDDVSTAYPGYDVLVNSGNILGAKLSNRTGEFLSTDPVNVLPGTQRGRSDKNDWFTYVGVYLKYNIFSFKPQLTRSLPDDSLYPGEVLIK